MVETSTPSSERDASSAPSTDDVGRSHGPIVMSGLALRRRSARERARADEQYEACDSAPLPYRLLRPTGGDGPFPLVLFLHGSGERGTDNRIQLRHGAGAFVRDAVRERWPAYVLAPQCPPRTRWVEVDWNAASHQAPEVPYPALAAALTLVEQVAATEAVDRERIYAVGASMGGFGVWDALSRNSHPFAAGVALCGGGDETRAQVVAETPIWAFHGRLDPIVPVARSRRMTDAVRRAGGDVQYDEYPWIGHHCWHAAFATEALYPWLFEQAACVEPATRMKMT